MKIENDVSILEIDLKGGAYSDFHLKDLPLNPINWKTTNKEDPPYKGHFLCFDRWGPPSKGEQKNGFLHHGEVNTQKWDLIKEPIKLGGYIQSSMKCNLPMGKLQIIRDINLSAEQPLIKVTEHIKNLNKYGRMYNIVQHVTLAPPFLDKTTLFDNNTEKGFEDKENGSLNQEKPILRWPETTHKKQQISLRQFQDEWPRVSSFVFQRNKKYGWVTASNPSKNLLLGYIWEIQDYPWVNFWRSMQNNNPIAFGIEFGTTGLHEPFPIVAKKGKIFGRNIYDFIDANEIVKKSFICFLAKIPTDYKGVGDIYLNNSELRIKEKNKISRDINYLI
ncbi:MAG: hypothetical protein BWY08_01072 [Bacteroidetes bacterium ADurb.Bin174]|nr:MAG: hypothetical protein BWY08_01072 [Bacteroidetes bacterium ADurb.Bin174]